METTLQDIAKELDLSATTVSRSLRHDTTISPATRARVNEVARRLGYKSRARRPARAVERDSKRDTLGLLMRYESLDVANHDSNMMKMMAGIMAVTDKQEMHFKVYPWQSSEQASEQRTERGEISRLPIIVPEGVCRALIAHGGHDKRDLAFLVDRLPVISMARIYRDLPIDAAIADNIEGVHRLVTHLVELGHRRLAWVGASDSATFYEERKTGFIKTCLTHNMELGQHTFFDSEIYKRPETYDTDVSLLAAVNAGVTGFVCGNDGVAFQVIRLLENAGKRVPADVSVTGFDAAPKSDQAGARRLTSIDPGFFEIGKAAARLALQRISHPLDQPCTVTARARIVLGDSTAPPPRASR